MKKMPQVSRCEMTDCSYNKDCACHAMAVTIGDLSHPQCDTFVQAPGKGGYADTVAGVGACKTTTCKFNTQLECQASKITVGQMGGEADCTTFQAR